MGKHFFSWLAIILVAIICIWNAFNTHIWNGSGVVCWDAAVYYAYLPKLINHKTDSLTSDEISFPGMAPYNKYVHDPVCKEKPRGPIIKTTMGMAVLYSPFYMAAWLQHYIVYGNGGSGYNLEYRRTMEFFGITCLWLSLIILRTLLKPYFKDGIVALTLLTVALSTNALYYADYEGCMTHVPDLMLFALFILLTGNWYKNPTPLNSTSLGLLAGLLFLIRPSNILLLIIFVFYSISSLPEIGGRIKLLLQKWYLLAFMALLVALWWVPQMLYWHSLTGQYIFYSYQGEYFDFLHPQILNGLFSWRKGWLIYTPVGALMLLGFIPMRRYAPKLLAPLLTFSIVHIYVVYSWWSWWYGGSFSGRPMVEAYAILAFPLASLFQWVYLSSRIFLKIAFSITLLLLTALNLFQTYQYTHGYIHSSDMTFAAYKDVFLQLHGADDNLLDAPPPLHK